MEAIFLTKLKTYAAEFVHTKTMKIFQRIGEKTKKKQMNKEEETATTHNVEIERKNEEKKKTKHKTNETLIF